MKRAILVTLVTFGLLFTGVSNAATCNTSYLFKAYVYQPSTGTYYLALTTTSEPYLDSQIEAYPTIKGYVIGRDQICDGYDFWSFANGTKWKTRDG